LFFANLNNKKYKTVTVKLKDEAKDKFYNAVKENGFKRACEKADFSWATLFSARKGEVIQLNSAEAICKKFRLNINDFFDKYEIEKPYKKETIKGYQRVLSPILEYAVRNEYINRNYSLSKYVNIGGKEGDVIKVLDKREMESLAEILNQSNIANSIPILLMLYLGLRKCEMCGLNWEDIDFEKRFVNIERNRIYVPKKGIIVKDLKTKNSKRRLFLVDDLFFKLQEYKVFYENLKQDDPEFDNCGAIYCNYDGTPRNPGYVDLLLKRFLIEANCHEISGHKLRHTWITTLITEGVPVNYVSDFAGHSSVDTTLKIYTHTTDADEKSKEMLTSVFSRKTVGEPNWNF